MVFSSPVFLFIFLPLTIGLYFAQLRFLNNKFRNAILLLFSYLFYLYGAGTFLLVLFISTLSDYILGIMMQKNEVRKRLWLAMSVIVNIGVLAYFKYANFFVAEFSQSLSGFGYSSAGWETIVLPIGISFFTFQKLSYVVDVYRGKSKPMINFVDFALYVAMFPQLIAGPIIRFHEISRQLRDRTESLDLFYKGILRFGWGLAKKVILANSCAEIADTIFSMDSSLIDTKTAWLGAVTYTLQIYFDFSGYSDMAIGLGMLFGFNFPENFNRPYSATSITDFWRRWHMSLSRWFRDYLYIPLGGNRKGTARTYFHLMIVFILCGFWHGANWTFLAWGLFHGTFLLLERVMNIRDSGKTSFISVRRTVTILIVIIGWVLFRSDSISEAALYLSRMFTMQDYPLTYELAFVLNYRNILFVLIASTAFFLPRDFSFTRFLLTGKGPATAAANIATIMIFVPYSILLIVSGSYNPFIYFRF